MAAFDATKTDSAYFVLHFLCRQVAGSAEKPQSEHSRFIQFGMRGLQQAALQCVNEQIQALMQRRKAKAGLAG